MKNKVVILMLTVAVVSTSALGGCGKKEASTPDVSTEAVFTEEKENETETEVVEPVTEAVVEEIEVAAESEIPAFTPYQLFAARTVNVREQANADSNKLGTLSVNDPVVVIGETTADGWLPISYGEVTAYAKAEYFSTEMVPVEQKQTASNANTGSAKKTGSSGKASSGGSPSASVTTSVSQNAGNTSSGGQTQASAPAEQPAPTEQPTQNTDPAPAPEQPENPAPSTPSGDTSGMPDNGGQEAGVGRGPTVVFD